MDQRGNTAVTAPSDAGDENNCGKVFGEARPVRWGTNDSHWHKLKPYQKRKFVPIEEVFKRPRCGWGWEHPRTGIVPYREWGTGLLKWDVERGWNRWNVSSIECPEFPDVLDEDIFELLRLFSAEGGRFIAIENHLYRWSIVLAAERAVSDLGR